MKKLLNLGIITLIGTSTTSLIACNKQPKEYSKEKLAELKKENKININGNTLEWIASQEKPFKQVDNKWYFVVWRGNKGSDWRIVKFKHFEQKEKVIDKYYKYELKIWRSRISQTEYSLFIYESGYVSYFWRDSGSSVYFKSVYCWNGNGEPNTPIIDSETGKIIDWNNIKKDK